MSLILDEKDISAITDIISHPVDENITYFSSNQGCFGCDGSCFGTCESHCGASCSSTCGTGCGAGCDAGNGSSWGW